MWSWFKLPESHPAHAHFRFQEASMSGSTWRVFTLLGADDSEAWVLTEEIFRSESGNVRAVVREWEGDGRYHQVEIHSTWVDNWHHLAPHFVQCPEPSPLQIRP